LKKWVTRKRLGQGVGDLVHRESAGVGGQDGVGAQVGRHPRPEQVLLHRHVLDDHLHHPVAIREPVQVVLEVAHLDEREIGSEVGRRRLRLLQGGEPCGGDAVAVPALLGHHVEEQHLDPRVGHVRGDGRAHDAGSQDGGSIDPQLSTLRSRRSTRGHVISWRAGRIDSGIASMCATSGPCTTLCVVNDF
jgi:hypothetical protein